MHNRSGWFIAGVVVIGLAPFLNQAFTVDDANFLALAAHSWPHPLKLYHFWINWLGPRQYAFDVLANPPLVPWYLRVVGTIAGGREWVFHLLFIPFDLLAIAGLYRLGRRFSDQADWTVLLSITAPVFLLPAHTVMPDVPLLAFFSLGTAIAIDAMDSDAPARALWGGLLCGMAALCRYSGMCVIPLLALYSFLHRNSLRTTVAALVGSTLPLTVWSVLSWWVYGRVHWHSISGFETSLITVEDLLYKIVYQASGMGLTVAIAGVILVLCAGKVHRTEALISISSAILALVISREIDLRAPAATLLAISFAAAALGLMMALDVIKNLPRWPEKGSRTCDGLFLALWVAGILLFNLSLYFVSVRYLILALPPTVLLVQRRIGQLRFSHGMIAAGATLVLSLVVSVADQQLANSYRDYTNSLPPATKQRWFLGHWGWQYYLEKDGAVPVDTNDRTRFEPKDDLVTAVYVAPQKLIGMQNIASSSSVAVNSEFPVRICSLQAQGCFYASWVAPGNTRVVLPFGFSQAPLEVFTHVQLR